MTNDTYIESSVVFKPFDCNVYALKLFFIFILSSVCVMFVLYMSIPYCKRKCKSRREIQVDLVNFDDEL